MLFRSPDISNHLRDQFRHLLRQTVALILGKIAGHACLDTGLHVVPQHICLNTAKRRDNSVDLISYVDAVAPGFNHLLQAANLPLNSPQPWDLPPVVYYVPPVFLIVAHQSETRKV